ncbi:MAG: hypothetical protein MJZ38_05250 [archaeon]|nr:hypothetical protein [archaeon]
MYCYLLDANANRSAKIPFEMEDTPLDILRRGCADRSNVFLKYLFSDENNFNAFLQGGDTLDTDASEFAYLGKTTTVKLRYEDPVGDRLQGVVNPQEDCVFQISVAMTVG